MGGQQRSARPRPHGGAHVTRGPHKRGCALIFLKKWVFNFIIWIFMIFRPVFGDFWPFLGDIGPFFRPDLGGKLGDGYQLQIYIKQAFLKAMGGDSE
jgi:hypothetical protein